MRHSLALLLGCVVLALVEVAVAVDPCPRVELGGPQDCNANGLPDDCDLGPQALGFAWNSAYSVGSPGRDFSSYSITPLDIDGDTDGDFVLHLDRRLLAFLNRGDGTFAEPVASPASPDSVHSVAGVDVQGDGIPDLITQNDFHFLSVEGVHFGSGDGTFGPFQPFSIPVPHSFIKAADVDGDQRIDLVVGDLTAQAVTTVVGNAETIFGERRSSAVEGTPYDLEVLSVTPSGTVAADRCEEPGGIRRDGFALAKLAVDPGVSGAIAVVSLSFSLPITLSLDHAHSILRFSVRAELPTEPSVRTARLVYQDGLHHGGHAAPIRNQISRFIGPLTPTPFDLAIELSSLSYEFRRGDANVDGRFDISDGVHTLQNLFLGGRRGSCRDAADFNDSGSVDISDAIGTFRNLFLGGPRPPAPGHFECGQDPTPDDLSCLKFSGCPE